MRKLGSKTIVIQDSSQPEILASKVLYEACISIAGFLKPCFEYCLENMSVINNILPDNSHPEGFSELPNEKGKLCIGRVKTSYTVIALIFEEIIIREDYKFLLSFIQESFVCSS